MMKLELTKSMFYVGLGTNKNNVWSRLKDVCNVPKNVKDEDILITLWIDNDNSMAEVCNNKTGNLIEIGGKK